MVETFFYFLLYAFSGWILENVYCWKTTGKFSKDNFLRSPIKPMYGIAPVLLAHGEDMFSHWLIIIALCFFVPTTVEYVTGTFLEKYFGRKWWDYSKIRFQFRGHVCLYFSLCWMFLSLGVLLFVHPMVVDLYNHVHILKLVIPVLMSLVCIDMLATSFRRKRDSTLLVMEEE